MAYEKSKVSSFGSGSLDAPPLVGFEYCHQFSRTPGEVPDASSLGEGEIAINLADGLLYIKSSNGSIVQAGARPNQVVSSGAVSNLTSGQQAEIEIGTIVTTTDGRRWVYKGEGSKTSEASYIELADITPVWSVIADKPATFTPSSHVHAISDVTDLQTALNGKQASGSYAAASHSHAIGDVTNLQTSLNGKVSAAVEWTANHTVADGTRYEIGDLVYSGGSVYRAIAANESIPVNSTSYWTLVGAGYRLNIDGRDIPNLPLGNKVSSITTGINGADQITNMVSLTQAEYDAIATKNASTFYVITG
jgi:hypothetical protein